MNTKNGFLIVEFTDGLQVIPEKWFNANEQSCIWPTKFKTKFRINKAIVTCEMPQQSSTWEHLPIKRIFGKADTYSNALEKLVNAQDTSHIENSDISSDEMRQERKKRRRVRAKKTLSSSSEYSDKDLCLNDDKENPIKRHKGVVNKLPTFPKLEHFASSSQAINVTNKSLQKPQNVLRDISNANNVINITDKSMNKTINKNNREELIEEPVINIERENYYEFKKQILNKINKILYKLDIMENRMCMLDEKMQSSSITQECDFQFPISTLSELMHFETQLQETKFKNGVVSVFKLVGGTTAHAMIRNVLKKSITNELAQYFSWAGKKKKRSFKNLSLATMIIQAVRIIHSHMTDNDIGEYISKWLAQATLRIYREKQSTLHDEERAEDQQ